MLANVPAGLILPTLFHSRNQAKPLEFILIGYGQCQRKQEQKQVEIRVPQNKVNDVKAMVKVKVPALASQAR